MQNIPDLMTSLSGENIQTIDEWEKYKLRKADFEAGQEVATTRMVEKLMEKQGLSLEEACELLDFEVKLYHETKKLMEEDELYGS